MVSLLLESGARVNAMTNGGLTPVGAVIFQFNYCVDIDEEDEEYHHHQQQQQRHHPQQQRLRQVAATAAAP